MLSLQSTSAAAPSEIDELFADGTWSVNERLDLTAGLRWTRETKDIDLRVAQSYISPFIRLELRSGQLGSAADEGGQVLRRAVGLGMGDGGNNFEILGAAANLHCAQFEIRALMQRDIQFNAAIIATDVEHMDCGSCTFADGTIKLVDGSSVLQDRTREVAACRHDDAFRRSQWPRGLYSGNVAIAPCLVVPCGRTPIQAANSLYPSRSSSSASSAPPVRVMRPLSRTWTKSGFT